MYKDRIRALAGPRYDPRHIEAYMRLEHGVLDGLSPARFRAEVAIGMRCVDAGGTVNAEKLAQSCGL